MKTPAWKLSAAVSAALTFILVGTSRAEDSFPPCWRGNPGTTYQNWSFVVSNNPAAPEVFTNVNGTAQASFVVGAFGTGWKATTVGARTGAWDLGQAGSASLAVPNFGGSPAWKYVQVQVTYFDAPGFYLPPVVSIAGGTLVSSQVINNQVAAPGNWKTYQTVWLLQPSPASETIALAGDAVKGLLIDQVVVDTRCATAGDGDVPAYRPCWRGQAGTTFQQWLFGVSNNPASIPAELVTNSFGVPHAVIVAGPSSSGYTEENASLGCRQGVWDLGHSGTMTLTIPNTPSGSGGSYKYLRLQVTQYSNSVNNVNAAVAVSPGTLVSQQQQTIDTSPSGGTWVVAQSIWRLGPPCPASEFVVLTAGPNGSLIDQVVVDTLCLDFACPADILAVADLGQCSKSNVTWTLPTVNGCTVTNVTSTPASGSTIPVGTNSVNSIIQDGEGGTRTCTFRVIVSDNEPPVARCQNITVNLNGAGQATITGADVDNGSTDNCGIAGRTVTPNSFTCANIGPNSVTLTVTDAYSNSATCNATVTVQDTRPPAITCPANLTDVPTDQGQCYATGVVLGVPVATNDNCGVFTVTNDAPAQFSHGSTTVTWTVVDTSGNVSTCQQMVTVRDHDPPTIACPPDLPDVHTDLGHCYATGVNLGVPVATNDNCGILTVTNDAPAQFPHGTTTVTWTVVDTSGNAGICHQSVTIQDHQAPAITTCPPDQTLMGCQGTMPDLTSGVVATDNCSTSFTITQDPAAGASIASQTTVVTITVRDEAGNSAVCNPTITLAPPTLSIGSDGQTITLTWPDGGTLLKAGALTGPWTPVIGAASPYPVPQPLGDMQFYRLRCD